MASCFPPFFFPAADVHAPQVSFFVDDFAFIDIVKKSSRRTKNFFYYYIDRVIPYQQGEGVPFEEHVNTPD